VMGLTLAGFQASLDEDLHRVTRLHGGSVAADDARVSWPSPG
jgi:hypothetical protein